MSMNNKKVQKYCNSATQFVAVNSLVLLTVITHFLQTIPGIHFVNYPDVILTREDSKQPSVGVVKLKLDKKNG